MVSRPPNSPQIVCCLPRRRIEICLRRRSPQTGVSAVWVGELSGDSRQSCLILEIRDWNRNAQKSRKTRAFRATGAHYLWLSEYWLGREGSNLRMAESKSAALPLGYAPSGGGNGGIDYRRFPLAPPVYRERAAISTGFRARRIRPCLRP